MRKSLFDGLTDMIELKEVDGSLVDPSDFIVEAIKVGLPRRAPIRFYPQPNKEGGYDYICRDYIYLVDIFHTTTLTPEEADAYMIIDKNIDRGRYCRKVYPDEGSRSPLEAHCMLQNYKIVKRKERV